MNSDEQLLHRFYAGETCALDDLAQRYDPILARIAYQILMLRTRSTVQATAEWDVNERLDAVWALILMTRQVNAGLWPHQRLSALTWLYPLALSGDGPPSRVTAAILKKDTNR